VGSDSDMSEKAKAVIGGCMVGSALVIAGAFVVWGFGTALMFAGILTLVAVAVLARP
jgi:hypothetical protein